MTRVRVSFGQFFVCVCVFFTVAYAQDMGRPLVLLVRYLPHLSPFLGPPAEEQHFPVLRRSSFPFFPWALPLRGSKRLLVFASDGPSELQQSPPFFLAGRCVLFYARRKGDVFSSQNESSPLQLGVPFFVRARCVLPPTRSVVSFWFP